jgi:hypothetical protein
LGDKVFTIVPLPSEVISALGPTRRVEGELNEHPATLAISSAPNEATGTPFLWAGKSMPDRAGLRPGDPLEARLRAASDDAVDVPADVLNALRSGGALDAWDRLSPGKKRALLHRIDTAKRAATRASRQSQLVDALGGGG